MRILVHPHSLSVGGSQVAAVDLATAVRDLGHDVIVLAPPGSLEHVLKERQVPVVTVPYGPRLSLRATRAVRATVRRCGIDLVHAYEQNPCVQAFYAADVVESTPVLGSIMSMRVPWHLPTVLPIVAVTRKKARDFSKRWPESAVYVVPPPVDTEGQRPGFDASAFRREHGLESGQLNVVLVSRLAVPFKLPGFEAALAAVGDLATELPIRLVLVGDGPARRFIERMASETNRRAGRRVVVLVGATTDPRPAYAAADVVIGSGHSLLRGMAFGKPAIVLGRQGYVELVTPENVDTLAYHGFYGVGDSDTTDGAPALRALLRRLATDGARRDELGRFGRDVVCRRYELKTAAQSLVSIYEEIIASGVSRRHVMSEAWRTPLRLARFRFVSARLRNHARRSGYVGDDAANFVGLGLAEHFVPGGDFHHPSPALQTTGRRR